VTESGDDLLATSEAIVADAERLKRIEERKQSLPENDPELLTLSREAEALARGLVPKAAAERELAEEVVGKDGSSPDDTAR
jgi:hypothetical protein